MPDEQNKPKNGGELTAPRFFAVPHLDSLKDHPVVGPHVNPNWRSKKRKKKRGKKKMRYAAYVRISSEDQIGNYSVDAQKRAIETWVVSNGGILTQVYVDEGHSGRTAERPAFKQLRRDARHRKFDAIVVHKFDRFARNRTESLAIKSLLLRIPAKTITYSGRCRSPFPAHGDRAGTGQRWQQNHTVSHHLWPTGNELFS